MDFFLGGSVNVLIELNDEKTRTKVVVKGEGGQKTKLPLFIDGDTCAGKVHLELKGKSFAHNGIKIEFVGRIELMYDRANQYEFIKLQQELAPEGMLTSSTSYDFSFEKLELQHESYNGTNVRLTYDIIVTVVRSILDVTKEKTLWVHAYHQPPEINNSLKMEVGIENALHIEFEYNKSKYHLKDVIVGKIYFLLVRIKIKYMELSIIKRETSGSGPNVYNESETVTKFEIMDGAPARGESIPIRLFLNGFDLIPTMRDINKKFSVRFYLNLVLVDEDDRRYFKQQEIILWRKRATEELSAYHQERETHKNE